MKDTLDYYNENAGEYINSTKNVEFTGMQDKFLSFLKQGARVLDFGCGSGRDTKYFQEKGFRVDAVDGADRSAMERYGTMRLPENLYMIGTVNMDETTFPFSKKVLDRANTIEFSYVDLLPKSVEPVAVPEPLNLTNDFLKTKYLLFAQCMNEIEVVDAFCAELQNINQILQKANAHVGYRVRDEIIFYLLNNREAALLDDHEAMDHEIIQKILPRIQGSSVIIKDVLCGLFKYCAENYNENRAEYGEISSAMLRVVQETNCRYKKSAEKIAFMMRRYEEDGFTSYWL